jgi:hypothetical protein
MAVNNFTQHRAAAFICELNHLHVHLFPHDREGGDGLSVEEMEDGPLMAAPLVIKAPTKTPTVR